MKLLTSKERNCTVTVCPVKLRRLYAVLLFRLNDLRALRNQKHEIRTPVQSRFFFKFDFECLVLTERMLLRPGLGGDKEVVMLLLKEEEEATPGEVRYHPTRI
eukprot:2249318-Rhodomonas_salina.1